MAGAKGEGRIASQHQHVRPWPDSSLSRVKFDFNLDIPWTGAGSPEAHGCKVPAQDLRAYSELGLYHVLTTTDPFVQQWSSRMYERVTPDEPEIILSTTEIPGGLTTYSSRSLFQDGRHGEKLNVMLRDCDTCIEIHKLNHNMLVRLTTVRRLPQTLGVRLFSSIRPEGSVAQSKEFRYGNHFNLRSFWSEI